MSSSSAPTSRAGAGNVLPGNSGNLNNANTVESSTTDGAGTTLFVNDAQEITQVVRDTSLDSSLAVKQTDDNSISLFMSKPHIIQSGSISGMTPLLVPVVTCPVARNLTGAYVPLLWKGKLAGYNLMRGTAVFKFVINAQPFQAGRILITFKPLLSNINTYSDTYDNVHKYDYTTLTQLPNVEMDLQDGVATMKAPYVAPALWHSRQNGYDWGTFDVYVLSPISSATTTTIDYTSYLYFEDFELAAPIYAAEMDMPMVRTQDKERKRSKKMGVVSTFFDSLTTPLDMLSAIPVIGSYSRIASTSASAISSFCGHFGWSRPLDNKGTQIVLQHGQYQGMNYNGTNASDVLAMDALNQLVPMQNFAGSGIDEMSFNYLKQIPAYVTRFSWSTAPLSGAQLFVTDTALTSFVTKRTLTSNSGTVTSGTAPPFVYLSRYFKYFRGSIVITLKFVKTQYHSGRVQVSFTPGYGTPNLDADEFVYREIIDIRESSTYSFTLPYMHPAPFLNTGWIQGASTDPTSFGSFSVRVLNPLVAAATVSSTIDCLVYVSAGEDFTLSALSTLKNIAFQPEMGPDELRVQGNIGGAPNAPATTVPHALCLGECFTSVKQLLQLSRPTVGVGNVSAGPDAQWVGTLVYPYILGMPKTDTGAITSAAVNTGPLSLDYVSELSCGFVFSRGGLRFTIPEPSEAPSATISWLNYMADATPILGPYPKFPWLGSGGTGIVDLPDLLPPMSFRTNSSCVLDVIVPHYGQTPMRINYMSNRSSNVVPDSYDNPNYGLAFAVRNEVVGNINKVAFRSGADDLALGYFVGFPPFLIGFNLE